MFHLLGLTKGLIKPKAVWARRRFVLFAVKSKKANKTNLFFVLWEILRCANLLLILSDL